MHTISPHLLVSLHCDGEASGAQESELQRLLERGEICLLYVESCKRFNGHLSRMLNEMHQDIRAPCRLRASIQQMFARCRPAAS